jgi:hypothetical protein
MREVFLNPGIVLLFGGILTGFVSRSQGYKVVQADDQLFVSLFQGMLCLFLLEMGITAAKRLQDLRNASWKFILLGLAAPNVFACTGMIIVSLFSHAMHQPLQLGTYVLFAVLCGAASYRRHCRQKSISVLSSRGRSILVTEDGALLTYRSDGSRRSITVLTPCSSSLFQPETVNWSELSDRTNCFHAVEAPHFVRSPPKSRAFSHPSHDRCLMWLLNCCARR